MNISTKLICMYVYIYIYIKSLYCFVFSNHAGVHVLPSMFLAPIMALCLLLVVVLRLQNHLIQNLRLHLGLLLQQRLRLPDQVVGLQKEWESFEGWIDRKSDKKTDRQTERTLTKVCCDLDRDSRISSTMRSDKNDAMLSFTSLITHRKQNTQILNVARSRKFTSEKWPADAMLSEAKLKPVSTHSLAADWTWSCWWCQLQTAPAVWWWWSCEGPSSFLLQSSAAPGEGRFFSSHEDTDLLQRPPWTPALSSGLGFIQFDLHMLFRKTY